MPDQTQITIDCDLKTALLSSPFPAYGDEASKSVIIGYMLQLLAFELMQLPRPELIKKHLELLELNSKSKG